MSSAKWQPFCLHLNMIYIVIIVDSVDKQFNIFRIESKFCYVTWIWNHREQIFTELTEDINYPTSPRLLHSPGLVALGLSETVKKSMHHINTVETLYSTIYYSKYFIELNFDKSTQYVALWTHKRHPIPRPFGRAMECLLWVLQQKLTVL